MQTMEKILISNALIWFLTILSAIFFAANFPLMINYYAILLSIAAIISLITSWYILQHSQDSSNLQAISKQIEDINSEKSFHKRIVPTTDDGQQKLATQINNLLDTTLLLEEQLKQHLNSDTTRLEALANHSDSLRDIITKNLSAIKNANEANKKLIAASYYDSLTELPNYLYFHELANSILIRATRKKNLAAILFLDIDNFTSISTQYNQDTANLYLIHIANQLKVALRKTDLLARIEKDLFIMAIEELHSKETIKVVLDRILSFLQKPLKIEGKKIQRTVSIGVSVFPDDSRFLDKLETYADFAAYFAKKQGGNIYCYYNDIKNVVSLIHQ